MGANTNTLVFENAVILVNSPVLGQNKKFYGFMGTYKNQNFQMLIKPEDLDAWFNNLVLNKADPKKNPILKQIERATHGIPTFPYLTHEQTLSLSLEKKELLQKDTQHKEQLQKLKMWVNSLELSEDRAYFGNYDYFIRSNTLGENYTGSSKQQLASMLPGRIYDPQALAAFKKSLSRGQANFIEEFEKLYRAFMEFTQWRNSLTKEQLDFIAGYRTMEKTSYAPVVSLLRQAKILIDKYDKVANDSAVLATWLSSLSSGSRTYIENHIERKKQYYRDLLCRLDQTLTALARIVEGR